MTNLNLPLYPDKPANRPLETSVQVEDAPIGAEIILNSCINFMGR
jgi:sulfonate transport system ATP-binding protein